MIVVLEILKGLFPSTHQFDDSDLVLSAVSAHTDQVTVSREAFTH